METNNKPKLTDTQLRVVQIITGIVAAAALYASIFLPSILVTEQNSLLNYLFVAVFLVIVFGRRSIENKYRLRLNLFSLTLMDGVLAAVIIFIAIGFFGDAAQGDALSELDDTIKVLIVVGLSLLLVVAGITLPILRYFKRVKNGTLPPIRLPEESEQPEEPVAEDAPATTEQKIAEMIRALDGDGNNSDAAKDDERTEDN